MKPWYNDGSFDIEHGGECEFCEAKANKLLFSIHNEVHLCTSCYSLYEADEEYSRRREGMLIEDSYTGEVFDSFGDMDERN